MMITEPWGKGLSALPAVSRSGDPRVRVTEGGSFIV